RGKAWSGQGPVTSVEVSLTGEGAWHPAQLQPPTGPYHWQDWTYTWDAADVGRHTLRARATDAAGNVQPEVPPWNRLGYGNNAIEVIYVDLRCPFLPQASSHQGGQEAHDESSGLPG